MKAVPQTALSSVYGPDPMTHMFPRTLALVVVVALAAIGSAPGCKMINSLSGNSPEKAAILQLPPMPPLLPLPQPLLQSQ